ncbi:right-handed parallel beta-helix repeat-containing protein [Streptomyces flavofungini]|uniref:right-handed parallel beta-helix repeat-containing protein n=1 Tax=Streptomyces flavofungini TaxID=68200 RepID=UPI0034DFC748
MKTHTSLAVAVTCLTAAGIGLSSPATAQTRPGQPEDLTVYVDATTRGVPEAPDTLRTSTVAEAQRIAEARQARNVTIRLAAGVHAPIDWSYVPSPGGRITLKGADSTAAATVVRCTRSSSEYGVKLDAGDANADVSNLTIEKCRHGGIHVGGASSVTVRNNLIRYIGSKYVPRGDPAKEGFGGVHLKGANRATISGNRFYHLENNGRSPAGVHGVYAANNSDGTTIASNRFGYISGDPIRFRHGSDNARVTSNRFWRAGYKAIVSDWRFGSEKCGKGTVLKANTVGNRTYSNAKYGSDASRNRTTPTMRKWGKDSFKPANLGGCTPAPVTFAGNNKWTASRPW